MKKMISIVAVILIIFGCSVKAPNKAHYVRHMIMWTLNDSLEGSQKEDIIKMACDDFNKLDGKVSGLVNASFIYEGRLPSSNCDFMFDMVFESAEALESFSEHPEHMKNAGRLKPYIKSRTCLDVVLSSASASARK